MSKMKSSSFLGFKTGMLFRKYSNLKLIIKLLANNIFQFLELMLEHFHNNIVRLYFIYFILVQDERLINKEKHFYMFVFIRGSLKNLFKTK